MKSLKKKIVSLGTVCALVASMAALGTGCSSGTAASSTPEQSSAPAESTAESAATDNASSEAAKLPTGQTLRVWTYMQTEAPTLKEYAQKWGEKTGNKVELIYQTANMQQFAQAAHSASGPDVVYGIANDNVATFATANLVKEVPDGTINPDDYTPASVSACKVDGKNYAIPIAIESIALFYNTDKVQTVPATFEELVTTAKDQGGIMFDASNFYYAYGFVRAEGGYVFKNNNDKYDVTDIGLGNDGSKKAYSFLNDLVNKYHYMNADVTGDVARSNFQNGKIAYYISGPWDVGGLKSAGTHFKVAPLPTLAGSQIKTSVGTQVAFVSANTKNEELAWDLIKYMGDESAVKLYEVGSRIPAKLSIQKSDEIQKDENTAAFIQQASYGEPMPTIPELSQVWTPAQNNIRLIFSGKETVDKAAEAIVTQLKQGITTMNAGK
jgi:arabinogalactan oligomer/maltooligosaccharide transport system substrate-binding protein